MNNSENSLMTLTIPKLDVKKVITAVSSNLQKIDPRLMDHGGRVAYIACRLCDEGKLPFDKKTLFLLCLFHDIGAYKTDEIDRMVEFETSDVKNHATYGYLFIKYMSPLSYASEAILYHHTSWCELEKSSSEYKEYAALIYLADRIDIAFLNRKNTELSDSFKENKRLTFKPEYVELADRVLSGNDLFGHMADGSYSQYNEKLLAVFDISDDTLIEYLKMLVYSIDFHSENTVTHTINTVAVALDIAKSFGLSSEEQSNIYIGALMHDAGKIAIPVSILEYPGRLSDEQMTIMRTHASETENILKDILPADICNIASRHHEKLDGTGYPKGILAKDLNFSERIVAVADIVSALAGTRSYKKPFPKGKTLDILKEMRGLKLDTKICDYVCENYDEIMQRTDNSRNSVIARYQAMLDEYKIL